MHSTAEPSFGASVLLSDVCLKISQPCSVLQRPLCTHISLGVQALSVLAGAGDADFQRQPAVVATRVALAEQLGDIAGAVSTVQDALQWWDGSSAQAGAGAKGEARKWLLHRLAQLQLKVRSEALSSTCRGTCGALVDEVFARRSAERGV